MRRHFAAVVLSFSFVTPLALLACGDDDSQPGPKDASAPEVAAEDTSVADGGADTNGPVVGQCSPADFDATAGANGGDETAQKAVTITFPTGPSPAQYTNRCIKVKAGTVVTFMGSFSNHPLEQNGGDKPTPIPQLANTDPDSGGMPITFATPGTFGFECNFHRNQMFGAVKVVP